MKRLSEYVLKSLWTQRLLRIIIGSIFIYASFDKIIHPDRFADMVMDYRILPLGLVNISAVWLPFLELLLGLLIIKGMWIRPGSLLLIGLCLLFIGGISYSLAKGINSNCGCFSTSINMKTRTWESLWQEGLILFGCIWLWATTFKRN